MAANGQYKISVGVVDNATADLRRINKEMEKALAPQRALQKETEKFYRLQNEGQKSWQSRIADAARSMDYPKLAEHFDRMALKSKSAANGVTGLFGAFRGLAGVVGVALTFASALEKAAAAVGRMGDDAIRLKNLQAITGTSPEKIRAIEGAGALNGVQAPAMDQTLVGFGNALQKGLMDPSSEAGQLLAANHIDPSTAKQWKSESPDKQLGHLADLFHGLKDKDGATKAQAASILGVDPSAIAMLERGAQPLQADIDTAQKNNPWTPAMQKAGEEYTRAMADLQQHMNHFGEEIAVHLIPAAIKAANALGAAFEGMTTALDKFGNWFKSFFGEDHTHPNANNRSGRGGGGAPPAGSAAPGTDAKPTASDPISNAWDWMTSGRHGKGQSAPAPITSTSMSPRAKALMDQIASKESGGDYTRLYGKDAAGNNRYMTPDQMASAGDLPGAPITTGPNAGKMSTASGKYQFINGTWQEAAAALGLKDHSPESQDKAGWWLAQRDYKKSTGRDLSKDVESKDPAIIAGIQSALNKTWTSLAGGIEQGQTQNGFQAGLEARAKAYEAQQSKVATTAPPTQAFGPNAGPAAPVPPPPAPAAAGPAPSVAANQNDPPSGKLDVTINGAVPGTKVSANARGDVFGGPVKVQQVLSA